MNTIMENTELCISTFTEIVQKLSSTVVNFVLEIFGESSVRASTVVKTNDGVLLNFVEVYKQLIGLLCFDHFQIQLLKIFLLTLITILFMIYGAWHVYGSRISDRFMYPAMNIDAKRNSFTNDT